MKIKLFTNEVGINSKWRGTDFVAVSQPKDDLNIEIFISDDDIKNIEDSSLGTLYWIYGYREQ